MQTVLDVIVTRAKKIYLGHPFLWRFQNVYDSINRLASQKTFNKNFNEEVRIAKKQGFLKKTSFGYKMARDIPITDFPDSEFEERYASRNLPFEKQSIYSLKK